MTRVLAAVVLFGLAACGGAEPAPAESHQAEAAKGEPAPKTAEEKTAEEKPAKKKRKPFAETSPVVGDAAPDFELANLAGEKVGLASAIPNGPTCSSSAPIRDHRFV